MSLPARMGDRLEVGPCSPSMVSHGSVRQRRSGSRSRENLWELVVCRGQEGCLSHNASSVPGTLPCEVEADRSRRPAKTRAAHYPEDDAGTMMVIRVDALPPRAILSQMELGRGNIALAALLRAGALKLDPGGPTTAHLTSA